MSDPLLPPLLLSVSGTSSISYSSSNSSDASASSGSSTPSASVRLSPLAEAEEGDVGEVCTDGGRSPLSAFVGADQLMLDLELLGFSCLEAEAVEGVSQVGAVVVGEGGDGGEKESVAEEEGVVVAEERGQAEGRCWAVDCRVGVGEKESIYGSEAEDKRKGEAEKRRRSEAEEKGKSEAEERDWAERNWAEEKDWAERRRLGELEAFSKNESVVGGSRLGERVAEGSHLGEGKGGYFAQREKTGCVAEKRQLKERKKCLLVAGRSQPHASAMDLVEFLGLGSSSDAEEDNLCVKGLGFEKPLAIVADERRLVEVEGSSGRLGECESGGLTEEVGVVRGRCSTLECWMTSGVKKCLF